jgi:hypothetical protein
MIKTYIHEQFFYSLYLPQSKHPTHFPGRAHKQKSSFDLGKSLVHLPLTVRKEEQIAKEWIDEHVNNKYELLADHDDLLVNSWPRAPHKHELLTTCPPCKGLLLL